jgi:hypothetical protein
MERYRLQDREAVVCASCGFTDVAADLTHEERSVESWEAAFERFYEKAG